MRSKGGWILAPSSPSCSMTSSSIAEGGVIRAELKFQSKGSVYQSRDADWMADELSEEWGERFRAILEASIVVDMMGMSVERTSNPSLYNPIDNSPSRVGTSISFPFLASMIEKGYLFQRLDQWLVCGYRPSEMVSHEVHADKLIESNKISSVVSLVANSSKTRHTCAPSQTVLPVESVTESIWFNLMISFSQIWYDNSARDFVWWAGRGDPDIMSILVSVGRRCRQRTWTYALFTRSRSHVLFLTFCDYCDWTQFLICYRWSSGPADKYHNLNPNSSKGLNESRSTGEHQY